MRVPIACTLSPGDANARISEWRALLQRAVIGSSRPSPAQLLLQLRGDPATVAEVAALAVAEHHCCAFFSFNLTIARAGIRLAIEVPPDADAILDDFATLLTAAPGLCAERSTSA